MKCGNFRASYRLLSWRGFAHGTSNISRAYDSDLLLIMVHALRPCASGVGPALGPHGSRLQWRGEQKACIHWSQHHGSLESSEADSSRDGGHLSHQTEGVFATATRGKVASIDTVSAISGTVPGPGSAGRPCCRTPAGVSIRRLITTSSSAKGQNNLEIGFVTGAQNTSPSSELHSIVRNRKSKPSFCHRTLTLLRQSRVPSWSGAAKPNSAT